MTTTFLLNLLSDVRADLTLRTAADRTTHQLGTAPSFNRPANWRPFVKTVLSDNLFAAPAGW